MIMAGADAVLLDRAGLEKQCPFLDFDNARFPIKGGLWQPRGGTVRHDAVAWGYARGADMRGVDIIQNCEVTGFLIEDGVCSGVETTRGTIEAKKTAVCVAGSSGRVMAKAGMRLPIESHVLQAFVSEGPQTGHSRRDHLRCRTLLRIPVRQGRPCLRRRHRRLQHLCPARQSAGGRGCLRGRNGHYADDRPRPPVGGHGAVSWTCPWTDRPL